MPAFRTITRCQGCGSHSLIEILKYGDMPLVNNMRSSGVMNKDDLYPMTLVYCNQCSLVQIKEIVDPALLFKHYLYFTSNSPSFLAHAKKLSDAVVARMPSSPDALRPSERQILEIASNDGYLLKYFMEKGFPVLGIDPAENIAQAANERGIKTLPEFFSSEMGAYLRAQYQPADVVLGLNVLAHMDNIHGVIDGIRTVLKPSGFAVFEFPYLRRMIEGGEFDTVYHEHLRYYSLTSIRQILYFHDMVIFDAEETPFHGGSLRVWVARRGERYDVEGQDRVGKLADAELDSQVVDPSLCYKNFAQKATDIALALRKYVTQQSARGDVAVYGASAKGTVLINFADIGDMLSFAVDKSPHKQKHDIPGTNIGVFPPSELLVRMPRQTLLTPWNFAKEIISEQKKYLNRGGAFIIPVPELKVITKENIHEMSDMPA